MGERRREYPPAPLRTIRDRQNNQGQTTILLLPSISSGASLPFAIDRFWPVVTRRDRPLWVGLLPVTTGRSRPIAGCR